MLTPFYFCGYDTNLIQKQQFRSLMKGCETSSPVAILFYGYIAKEYQNTKAVYTLNYDAAVNSTCLYSYYNQLNISPCK